MSTISLANALSVRPHRQARVSDVGRLPGSDRLVGSTIKDIAGAAGNRAAGEGPATGNTQKIPVESARGVGHPLATAEASGSATTTVIRNSVSASQRQLLGAFSRTPFVNRAIGTDVRQMDADSRASRTTARTESQTPPASASLATSDPNPVDGDGVSPMTAQELANKVMAERGLYGPAGRQLQLYRKILEAVAEPAQHKPGDESRHGISIIV